MKIVKLIKSGVLLIMGFFLIIESIKFYYYYNYTDLVFVYVFPNYQLFIALIMGGCFTMIGCSSLLKKTWKGDINYSRGNSRKTIIIK